MGDNAITVSYTHLDVYKRQTPYCARVVWDYVNEVFDGKVIRSQEATEMPSRSPDLMTMDFFFWGLVKDTVYAKKPKTIDYFKTAKYNYFINDLEHKVFYE